MSPSALPPWILTAVAGVALLAYSVTRLVRLIRESVILRVPIAPLQTIRLEEAGSFVLHVEGHRLRTGFAGVRFELSDPAYGREVPSRAILLRTQTASFSRVRTAVRRFTVDHPGEFELRMSGLGPGRDYSREAAVLTRPYGGAMVAYILGIVLGGLWLAGGVVISLLLFNQS